MTRIAGVFEEEQGVDAAYALLADAGYRPELLAPSSDEVVRPTVLRHRSELILRSAVRWGIGGALIVEVSFLIAMLLMLVDTNVRVFIGVTVWKFGAALGAWIGAVAASESGLDSELAAEYETHLAQGRCVLSADVRRRDRPFARGALVESGAVEVRDVVGTFEVKRPKATKSSPVF